MAHLRALWMVSFLLSLPSMGFATSRGLQFDDDVPDDDDRQWSNPQRDQEYTEQVLQGAQAAQAAQAEQAAVPDGAQAAQAAQAEQAAVPDDPALLMQGPVAPDTEVHAKNAKRAAKVAKQAAKVANKVAAHSIKVTGHAKKALKHALGALHDARVDSNNLDKDQKASLKKAEAHLREATKTAEHGELKKIENVEDMKKKNMQKDLDGSKGMSERAQMRKEIEELRKQLKEKNIDDPDINKALDELEADLNSSKGPVNDESKAELERLRQSVDSLDAVEAPVPAEAADKTTSDDEAADQPPPTAQEDATPIEEKGLDIDTEMPYGDLEPFGREDTAQELTEQSITESDEMVDQLERAEVAEEKRAVFRALTRLRGAAITSFDGVARSQTGNIDEYNKIHKWRSTHPLHHLADEESDVSKWAFPDNAD